MTGRGSRHKWFSSRENKHFSLRYFHGNNSKPIGCSAVLITDVMLDEPCDDLRDVYRRHDGTEHCRPEALEESLHGLPIARRYVLMRRHTRQQHQANTAPIAISASSVLTRSMSTPLVRQSSLDLRDSLFLTSAHRSNTQQRTARSISRARSAAEVKHAA